MSDHFVSADLLLAATHFTEPWVHTTVFEVLHFYKTSLLCEVMHSTFADMKHLKSLRSRFPDLYDFIQDPGHHQQPCVYLRLSPWHSPCYIGATEQDVLRREHSRCRKYLQLLQGQHAFFEPALHYWKRSNNYWLFCAIPVEIKLPTSSAWIQESKWQYMLRPHLNAPWVHRLLRKTGFREHLVDFRRHSLSSPTSLSLHKRFRRRLHPDLHRQLRPEMLDDIQAHYSTLYRLGSNTGASFQTMRDLLSAAFPSTQLYYFQRLSTFVNEPFRSVLRKRQLQVPTAMTQLFFHLYMFETGKLSLEPGCSVGWHLTVTSNHPGLWKLAVPPWETGSTTTASGSEDGLRIRRSRVAALTWTTAPLLAHIPMR